jgi:hypothetical protein
MLRATVATCPSVMIRLIPNDRPCSIQLFYKDNVSNLVVEDAAREADDAVRSLANSVGVAIRAANAKDDAPGTPVTCTKCFSL